MGVITWVLGNGKRHGRRELKRVAKGVQNQRRGDENEYLGVRMEHKVDIRSNSVLDVMEGSVGPLRVSRISSESFLYS